MASTFTPNLNLEKPSHGEKVDGWDEVLNSNFDLIDGSIRTVQVRTSDPILPASGEQWIRSDLAELRIRVGSATYKIDLSSV